LKKATSKSLPLSLPFFQDTSQQGAKTQKFQAVFEAFWKSFYGKRYTARREAYDLASGIQTLRCIAMHPETYAYRLFKDQDLPLKAWAAKSLLATALTSNAKLRQVADVLDFLDTPWSELTPDARQLNILRAYAHCDNDPPTLGEVRQKFLASVGRRCWPTDFSVRKTLKSLGLPLAKAKRGRPRAKSRKRRRRSTYSTKRYVIGKLATQDG
jgi:hypothetical protein